MTPPYDPQTLARAILRSGRFHLVTQHRTAPPKSLLQIVAEWIGGAYRRLFDAVFAHVHPSHAAGVAFGAALIAAALTLIVIVAMRLTAGLRIERAAAKARADTRTVAGSEEHYARASDAAGRGDYRRAVIALFAAAVSHLGLRGFVSDDASATVRQLRAELRARNGALLVAFDPVARAFVAAAYAQQTIDAEQWENARRAYASIAADSVRDAA